MKQEPRRVTVDVLPEESGGLSLWVRELNMGSHGDTLHEARAALLHDVRSYVRHYLAMWDMYRHISDTQAQLPHVWRLSLADDDRELAIMLFGKLAEPDE